MSAQPATLQIGLLWHSLSSGNLGVGALTESHIVICEEAARVAGVRLEFVLFGNKGRMSYGPAGGTVRSGGHISPKQMLTGRSAYVRDVAQCDVVLDIGEGDSFTDIYGMRRFITHIASKLAVLRQRRPLVLSPQTIGPFDRWYTRALAVQVMKRCERVFARDGQSADYLRACGVNANTEEVVDVAFKLPFTRAAASPNGTVRIGLNVSGLLYAGGYTGKNQFDLTLDYPTLMRRLLSQWTADPTLEVWLISHVIESSSGPDNDRSVIETLANEFPAARMKCDFTSPSEAKSFISGMDFVTGARMHACIAAFSAGVPVVPLAYSRKFNGLFKSLEYPWVADAKAIDGEAAATMIFDGFNQRDKLRAAVGRGNEIALLQLRRYTDFLADIFRTASTGR